MRFPRILLPLFVLALPSIACSTASSRPDAGAPCSTDDDCSQNTFCTWPTSAACGQKGNCVPAPDPSTCSPGPRVCPCSGGPVTQATCGGVGEPMTGSLGCLHAPCTTNDQCNPGLTCQVSECYPPGDGGPLPDAGTTPDAASGDDASATDAADATSSDSGAAADATTDGASE